MNNYDHYLQDDYAEYEADFSQMKIDRKARRKRKHEVNHVSKKAEGDLVDEIAEDATDSALTIKTTYKPGIFEEEWLMSSLTTFFDRNLITDVLGQVKGGKEASVYRCEAFESTGVELLAAKVYRPRKFRQLSNDRMYREGREILKAGGEKLDGRDDRIIRALNKKTTFGQQVAHTSWLTYEFNTLKSLHELGADVPKVYAAGDNAILMEYFGDPYVAAPLLTNVRLELDEAQDLFKRVMWNIDLMLQNDAIHGDLSAYNILYWEGDITIIDFPQVTNPHTNSNARFILERDITRVCEYFQSQGVRSNPGRILDQFWKRYLMPNPEDLAADLSRFEIEDDE